MKMIISYSQEQILDFIQQGLSQEPAKALQLLCQLSDIPQKQRLALAMAQSWARQDINAAWNAVLQSTLSASEKQLMFNELWG